MKKVLALFLALMMVLPCSRPVPSRKRPQRPNPPRQKLKQKPNRPQKKHPLPPAKTSSSISWAHSILTRPSPI